DRCCRSASVGGVRSGSSRDHRLARLKVNPPHLLDLLPQLAGLRGEAGRVRQVPPIAGVEALNGCAGDAEGAGYFVAAGAVFEVLEGFEGLLNAEFHDARSTGL